jgi:serine/threonine protein kinase
MIFVAKAFRVPLPDANAAHGYLLFFLFLFFLRSGKKGDELYMVLEFCAGGDFSKYLAKQPDRRLTEEHARYFMRQLASGLRFLRSKQVIHRDLKPQVCLFFCFDVVLPNLLVRAQRPVTEPAIGGQSEHTRDCS